MPIEASAPVRICDNGGWTDTWFGGPGRVLNIAVNPGVAVVLCATGGPEPVVVDMGPGDRYPVTPETNRVARHALVEAAIDVYPPPPDVALEVAVRSDVPAGSGAGTSAALAVALVGALTYVRSERLSPRDIAYAAHRLEVDVLGTESGIQDQLSSALGGINYLEIERYPEASVQSLPAWDELARLLTLVFLGRPHDSSGIHRHVIAESHGKSAPALACLRAAAVAARDAVLALDLSAFGSAMAANTEAQAMLHPDLVGTDAKRVIEMAADRGAIGWKVNGAGGDGGSVTILHATPAAKRAFEAALAALDPAYRALPVAISQEGVRVRGSL